MEKQITQQKPLLLSEVSTPEAALQFIFGNTPADYNAADDGTLRGYHARYAGIAERMRVLYKELSQHKASPLTASQLTEARAQRLAVSNMAKACKEARLQITRQLDNLKTLLMETEKGYEKIDTSLGNVLSDIATYEAQQAEIEAHRKAYPEQIRAAIIQLAIKSKAEGKEYKKVSVEQMAIYGLLPMSSKPHLTAVEVEIRKLFSDVEAFEIYQKAYADAPDKREEAQQVAEVMQRVNQAVAEAPAVQLQKGQQKVVEYELHGELDIIRILTYLLKIETEAMIAECREAGFSNLRENKKIWDKVQIACAHAHKSGVLKEVAPHATILESIKETKRATR